MSSRTSFLLHAALALMTIKPHNVHADCRSDLLNINAMSVLTIQENSLAGTVLMEITNDFNNLEHDISSDSFVTVTNGSIVVQVDVFLDGPKNTENCAKSANPPNLKFFCKSDSANEKTVNFIVNYTNDFGPYFSASETSVNESLPVGSTVIALKNFVVDDDCTTIYNFFIDDESRRTFQVIFDNLVLLKNLDYEAQTEHYVNITATTAIDGGEGSLSNSTIVTIHVLDEDDMSPVFNISQFLLRVPEGQDVSAIWYNTTPPILAFDGDVGVNEPLVYSVHSATPNIKLQINNATGEVRILEQLDRENIPAYTVVVQASQKDVAYRTATATLSLLVDDVNDNRPVFTPQPPATIMENAPDGSYVMELSGEDQDEGDNSLFDFIIISDSVAAFKTEFRNATNKSVLLVANSTALRGQAQAVVQFYLKERRPVVGQPCTNTTNCVGRVTIDITDVNDNSPEFNASSYTFALPSNTSGHYVIGQVFAHDGDRGDNAVVKYSFTLISGPSDCSNVALNLTTGVLTTEQQLPSAATCSWIVTACDSPKDSNSRRCSSVPLTMAVVPSGNVVENSVTIPENVPIGTMVKPMPMKGLQTTSTEFEIRADVLYTKVLLDREQKDRYEVTITTEQNPNSVVMIVYVNVSDVNDNAPVFGQSVYVINIDRNWKINQTVLQVNATDRDIGINARLTFSMATGKEYFDIDATTGHVRLTNFPTARDSEYQLLVTDSGQPSFSSMSTLKVYNPVYNETATVLLPVNRDELLADSEGLARKLGSILGLSVTIHNIESLGPAADLGSKVYISATRAQGQPISPTELNELLKTHAQEIYNTFSKPITRDDNSDDGILSVLEIVLICVACVLLLLLLLIGFLWYRSNKKLRQSRRLFDSLNKDTTIYDNPRKPSSSAIAAASSSSNNSTNAQRLMARLSSGSLGNSSVTNLLSAQRDGNNSEGITPPGSNSSQRRQNNDYQNVFIAPLSSGVIINESIEDTSPNEAHPEQITTFSSQINDDDLTNPSYPYLNTVDSVDSQPDYAPSQTWPGDNTAFSGRRGSDVDSGTISDKETQLEDEDDKEVADILSDPNPLTHSREDTVDPPISRSNLDLMTTSNQPEDAHPEGIDNAAFLDTETPNLPPEPEPDYAKKVRFSDASVVPVENIESISKPDSDDKDLSLAKFLNQYGGAENLATDADTTQDSLEEMTAL